MDHDPMPNIETSVILNHSGESLALFKLRNAATGWRVALDYGDDILFLDIETAARLAELLGVFAETGQLPQESTS